MYYNNSLHGHVGQLARASNERQRAMHSSVSITISGSGLGWHDVASYFRPNAIERYSFTPDNELRFNSTGRLFDAAIMMDCSQCPVHPTLRPIFFEYAKRHSDTVRANNAEPIFLMTWSYADKPEMTQASIYNVSPVGNSYTGGLDAASARHLQEVAWETVSQYHKR